MRRALDDILVVEETQTVTPSRRQAIPGTATVMEEERRLPLRQVQVSIGMLALPLGGAPLVLRAHAPRRDL